MTTNLRAVVAHDRRLGILGRLLNQGPATAGQLSVELAADCQIIRYHLGKLWAHGLIHRGKTPADADR